MVPTCSPHFEGCEGPFLLCGAALDAGEVLQVRQQQQQRHRSQHLLGLRGKTDAENIRSAGLVAPSFMIGGPLA